MKRLLVLTSTVGLLLGAAISCDSDDGGDGPTDAEACQMVIAACHNKDDGMDEYINTCHQTAHDDGACAATVDDCVAACDAAEVVEGMTEGHMHESGGHETGHETGGHEG